MRLASELERARRSNGAGQQQSQALGIVAAGLNPYRSALDRSGPATLGPSTHRGIKVRQGEIALVRWPREPFRRYSADALAAGHVHLIAADAVAASAQNFDLGHGSSP